MELTQKTYVVKHTYNVYTGRFCEQSDTMNTFVSKLFIVIVLLSSHEVSCCGPAVTNACLSCKGVLSVATCKCSCESNGPDQHVFAWIMMALTLVMFMA